MRILILNDTFSHEGGTEGYISALLPALKEAGHDVYLAVGETKETLPEAAVMIAGLKIDEVVRFIRDKQIEVVYFQTVDNLDVYNKLPALVPCFRLLHDTASVCKYHFRANQFCSEKLSLIHCFQSAWVEGSMSKNPVKIFSQVERRRLITQKLSRFKKIFVNSQFTKASYVREGVNESLIEVLPLFPTVMPDKNLSLERKENIIVFSGRIFREKGIEYIIKAFSQVIGSAQLWVVGEGWELERSKQLAASLSLDKWVKFFGFVDKKKLKEIYSQASIGVVPSIWGEPFGLSGIEMMSFGLPVVGFNSGGISEWLRSNYNGFLVDRVDWQELAEKINLLILDKDKRLELGKNAQKFVADHYTIKDHVSILEKDFTQSVNKPNLNKDDSH